MASALSSDIPFPALLRLHLVTKSPKEAISLLPAAKGHAGAWGQGAVRVESTGSALAVVSSFVEVLVVPSWHMNLNAGGSSTAGVCWKRHVLVARGGSAWSEVLFVSFLPAFFLSNVYAGPNLLLQD